MYNVCMQNRVLGVLGGRDLDEPKFKLWAENCNFMIAADSGADTCLRLGIVPDVIIGDFDSLESDVQNISSDMIKIEDQNLSDCDKLLGYVADHGATEIVMCGVEGDRLDHLLGSLSSFIRSDLRIRIATRDGLADLLKPGSYRYRINAGRRFSVMPLRRCEKVTLKGAVWPLENSILELGFSHSLSNCMEHDELEISFEKGVALLLISMDAQTSVSWPSEDTV